MAGRENAILGRWNYIFLLGESGGGKGTLVKNIKSSLLPSLESSSMGDVLREKSKTDENIKSLTEQGILIDDAFVVNIFKELALDQGVGIIDGFPRNRVQALESIKFIKKQGWRVLVIDLKCDIEVIIERLLSRGRADDKLAVVYKRNQDHRALHPMVMQEVTNRTDCFDVITLNGNKPADIVYTNFLLEALRLVDLLYLYDFRNKDMKFEVRDEETTINPAVNRWLSNMLINMQQEIDLKIKTL